MIQLINYEIGTLYVGVISFYLLHLLVCIRHPRHVQVCPRNNNNNNSIRDIIESTRAHYKYSQEDCEYKNWESKTKEITAKCGKWHPRDSSLIALIKVVERIQRIFFLQESPEIPQKRSS